jgi:hypothetical protein
MSRKLEMLALEESEVGVHGMRGAIPVAQSAGGSQDLDAMAAHGNLRGEVRSFYRMDSRKISRAEY